MVLGYVGPASIGSKDGEKWRLSWRLTEKPIDFSHQTKSNADLEKAERIGGDTIEELGPKQDRGDEQDAVGKPEQADLVTRKNLLITDISIMLTIVSIAVAFFISLVEFMGIASEKCTSCAEAAENDPGLSGRWWRFWIAVNDNSGYLGAGIVGLMLVIILGWVGMRWWNKRRCAVKQAEAIPEVSNQSDEIEK